MVPTRGFTLIEILVVMALIATLLTIAVPQYFRGLERSKESVLRENLRVTREAIDRFYGDIGRYPEDLHELVSKRYLRSLPQDPVAESSEAWIVVPPPVDAALAGGVYDLKSSAPAYAQW